MRRGAAAHLIAVGRPCDTIHTPARHGRYDKRAPARGTLATHRSHVAKKKIHLS